MLELKIFSLRKNTDPPYEVIRDEIAPNSDGDLIVVEHRFYEMELHYKDEEIPIDFGLAIDGDLIDPLYLTKHEEEHYIKANMMQFFSNRLGYITIWFCGYEFTVRVDASKLTGSEAEQLFSYLYDKNKDLLLKFFSGEIKRTDKEREDEKPIEVEPKKTNELTLRNLGVIYDFLEVMEELYYDFWKLPHSIIRKKLVVEPYRARSVGSKSIEWLLSHLDEVHFDDSFAEWPEAIEVGTQYGVLDRVASEVNTHDYRTYENETILGALERVHEIINKVDEFLRSFLEGKNFESTEHANYKAVQFIFYKRSMDELEKLRNKFYAIEQRYTKLFEGVRPLNEYPKVTHVFLKKRHYSRVYTAICSMRQFVLNLNQSSVMNLNFLDQLYELFNYYRIIDVIKDYLKNQEYEIEFKHRKGMIHKYVCFTGKKNGKEWVLNMIYNPKIERDPGDTHLVLHGKVDKKNHYYTPDFVLEYSQKHDIRYAVIDAKYKRAKVVVEQDIKDAALKYYTCLRVFGTSHHLKPDFLWLLCPDSMQYPIWKLNYNEDFLPIIGVVESKPDSAKPLQQVIGKILNRWHV
ncbi:hypothetical protein V6R21_12850 [Limibacter armeniacum]|uniref:hypothetical protein n=1 Tax=Limibacter armeniacum TaxID=466084 RepID=UPI002FE55A1F